MRSSRLLNLSVVFLCLVIAGCGGPSGPDLVECSGTVTFKGDPLAGATVTFMVPNSPIAMGVTGSDGKFVITTGGRPGAPVGDAKVGVVKITAAQEAMQTASPDDMRKMAETAMAKGNKSQTYEMPKSEIPEKYTNPQSSGLTATISTDPTKNVFVFPLVE